MPINEDFLFYVWQFQLFSSQNLATVDGVPVRIIHQGILNRNAGPDFHEAKIVIGDTEWVGNVEIHTKASDWDRHNHVNDAAYNNVILHVVNRHDSEVIRNDGTVVPTLEIGTFLSPDLEIRYQNLVENLNWIPCEKQISSIKPIVVNTWLQRMLIERLEAKSAEVFELLKEYKGSWDDVFYVLLARNFGFKVNAQPFEMLARCLPQQLLAKHKNNSLQIEALVFGTAGFLDEEIEDQYHQKLKLEYSFLKTKYHLSSVDRYLWKFMRLRPQNFPTLRLAQFSALVLKSSHLISKVLEISEPSKIAELFKELPVNAYWSTHFRFEKASEKVSTELGSSSVNNILLNSVAVTLFSYGKYVDDEKFCDRAVNLLAIVPFEQNQITSRFVEIGIEKGNSDRSQALLHLKNNYCDAKKCLTCAVGIKIVNPT